MSDVTNWATVTKGNLTSAHYLAVTSKKKLQAISLFPSLATAGVGVSLYTGVTNQNQLNMRSLVSNTTGMLTIVADTNDIDFDILPAGIDLDLCDNTTSLFLKTVNLAADVSTTVLPMVNGGTSLATIAKGSLMYASATNTIAATSPMATHGQLLIGNATAGFPSVATLTAGSNVTVTNAAGSITIAANLTTLAANLDTDTYDINLNAAAGTSWISGDGTHEGMMVDASGRVGMGDSVPTAISLTAQLSLFGNATNAIQIGNNNNYKDHKIKALDATGANAGVRLTVEGAAATIGNNNGGNVTIKAGDAAGTGTSGKLILEGGDDGAAAVAGTVDIKTYTGAASTIGLQVDTSQNVRLPNGFLMLSQTPQSLTGAGAVDITSQITHFTDTGANALTLADGAEGQTKMICQIATSGGAGTLTPTNLAGGTTITFNAVGENVHLLFTNSNWHAIGISGATVA